MTKASHAGQDLVGGLRPDEGFRRRAAAVDIGQDREFERAGAPVRAVFDLFLGELREPAFDEVEPRAPGGREVQVEPRPTGQPAVNARGLVRAVVVENQVHVQLRGHGGVDGVEELAELEGPMAPMQLADNLPAPLWASKAANSDVVPWRT